MLIPRITANSVQNRRILTSLLKTSTVFLDLTAAYDTVWHTGLLEKLNRHMPYWNVRLTELLPQGRRFWVHLGEDVSSRRIQKIGIRQGSVLAPTLFNLYTNDLPVTGCRKFIYADDICQETQYLLNFNALSQQIWHAWKNIAAAGDSIQVFPRLCAVCSTYTTPAQVVNWTSYGMRRIILELVEPLVPGAARWATLCTVRRSTKWCTDMKLESFVCRCTDVESSRMPKKRSVSGG